LSFLSCITRTSGYTRRVTWRFDKDSGVREIKNIEDKNRDS